MKIHINHLSIKNTLIATAILLASTPSTQVYADASGQKKTAPLKPDVPYVFVVHNGRSIRIERDVFDSLKARINIRGVLLQQSDSCPPFCLQPMQLDIPVETVGEHEIIDFMLHKLRDDSGVLVDVRSRQEYETATIPGSVNFFIQDIQKGSGDEKFDAMLKSFGAKKRENVSGFTRFLETIGLKDNSKVTDTWDFSEAKELVVWTNSSINKISVDSIKLLHEAGYPASKLKWYRGGLASWQYWGFNTYSKPKR